ncbi:Protein of unknown function [Caloramator fervidus]|uniref:DUF1659 domain-containing protein n=1 Tax=Caloramator fervidus TaxID=29344 RepID=A0A1H5RLY2_9CLOT|nr:DUF1659 domain-containing protein [Caloramator fervidus]SEF39356.1 Protein of unknown function [Caloramator fervidus]
MAVTSVKVTSNVIFKVKVGVDQNGNDIEKNVTLKRIKANAQDQDVFDVVLALSNLLEGPVQSVTRQDISQLINA